MKMGEFLNPKNTWAIIHCKRILEEFLGLLIEMNSASKALSFRYEMIKFGEPEGAARDFSFDKEGNMQKFALEGVGAALIIGTDSLIKGVLTLSEGSKEIEKGPVVGKVLWIELIRTCGNFVRHGKEWESYFREFCENHNTTPFTFEPKVEFIEHFLTDLKKDGLWKQRAAENLMSLQNAGIDLEEVLYFGKSWDLANEIRLTDVEYSMDKMREFIESLYEPFNKKV